MNEIPLHHFEHGAGEPVLFVHGFPLSAEVWTEIARRLPSTFRSIAPDLRGHGRSPVSGETDMAAYATDLLGLLDSLGVAEPVVVVGHSMGGYIALEMVRRAPSRVRALVLVNTRASADPPEQADARLSTAERLLSEGTGFLAADMAAKLFSPSAPAELRERWRAIMAATPSEGAAAALVAMARRPDSLPTLRSFSGPTLIVAGADDAITSAADAEAMADAAPDATLRTIAGAGHLVPVEEPDRFQEVLVDFLGSLPRGGGS